MWAASCTMNQRRGGTLFIEPPIAIELMNRLRELESEEVREVLRILRALTEALRPHGHAMTAAFEALIELDSLFARARYALRFAAHRPEILPAGAEGYRVVTGFHPLLLASGAEVVPFDLTLDPGERTLLISGPNTGGKTVLLKAMGLINALAQAGVLPPVNEHTRLPLFEDIFADIGDEQSIEASLSTFSAHLKNIREILDGASHTSLVLMDEVGSGTDPAEGGALAQAVLVELTRRSTMTVATTHLGQLKLLAADEAGVVNASLQFDSALLQPTYRLLKGIPGPKLRARDCTAARFSRCHPGIGGELPAEIGTRCRAATPGAGGQGSRDDRGAGRGGSRARGSGCAAQGAGRARAADPSARKGCGAAGPAAGARSSVAVRGKKWKLRSANCALPIAEKAEPAQIDEAARAARRRVEQMVQQQAERMPEEDEEEVVAGGVARRNGAHCRDRCNRHSARAARRQSDRRSRWGCGCRFPSLDSRPRSPRSASSSPRSAVAGARPKFTHRRR